MKCENCAGFEPEHVCPSDDARCVQLRAEVARLRAAALRLIRATDEYSGHRSKEWETAEDELEALVTTSACPPTGGKETP